MVGIAAGLAGCGDDDAPSTADAAMTSDAGLDAAAPEVDAGGDASMDRFPECETYARAVCARYAECTPGFFLWASGGTVPACEHALRSRCALRRTLPDVATRTEAEAYEREYLAWVSDGCEWTAEFLVFEGPVEPSGQRGVGEPCSDNLQCGIATIDGRQVNLDCRGVETSAEAPFGDGCETGTCTAPGIEGATCDEAANSCSSELLCLGGRCAPRLADGDACERRDECGVASACFGEPQICRPVLRLGAECDPAEDACGDGFLVTCDSETRRCAALEEISFLAGIGERCDGFSAFCPPVSAECVESTCVERRYECGVWACAEGETCLADRCAAPVCE